MHRFIIMYVFLMTNIMIVLMTLSYHCSLTNQANICMKLIASYWPSMDDQVNLRTAKLKHSSTTWSRSVVIPMVYFIVHYWRDTDQHLFSSVL